MIIISVSSVAMLAQAGFVLPIQFGQWLPIGAVCFPDEDSNRVILRRQVCEPPRYVSHGKS